MILPRAFLRQCRQNRRRSKIVDSLGTELNGGDLLLRTLIFRRLLLRMLSADEKFVGLLLPPSVPAVVVNAAMPLAGRIGVNLNYTVTSEVLNSHIAQCGIRHVLTSRRFMERFDFQLKAELVFLEDLRDKVTLLDKAAAFFQARLMPLGALERMCGLDQIKPDDVMTVIFTSGSTGEPKGVLLSYENIGSNVAGINDVIHLTRDDTAMGILPFFHSFGYTATLWTMLALDPKGAYHTNPLEAQQVGKLAGKHRVTIIMATPTFLRGYIRRCSKEDFAAVEVVVTGAEKLPPDVADGFEQKFGVRPVEGYGVTELSPCVAVNVPASRMHGTNQVGAKEGTVGRPLPGVQAKIVHPETFADVPAGESGMLLIKGPNVMLGYFNRPDLTAKVMRDGWYITGDMARLDADGFITITGRQSRFSKIGGEMVPHILIEETLQKLLSPEGDELKAAVTALPDPRKGERIVVLHTDIAPHTADDLCKHLTAAGLPNIWIPSPDSYFEVPQIPVLGTGKLDLAQLKLLAGERASAAEADRTR